MAVIQISRIQVRRGVADLSTPSGLPQLASGEIGWAIDQQRLWIGSGSVEEGAPAVENVEVLTVPALTNILATFTASNYTYKLNEGSGGGALGATDRTIQSKLDDRVSAADFGINNGDNVTAALQNALNELYVINTLETDGPVLEFPPGSYNLTATIYLPPNAKLKGVGPGKTTFTMLTTSTAMFQTADSNGDPLIFSSPDRVSGILLDGFTFQLDSSFTTTNVDTILKLDKTYDTEVNNCEFIGVYDLGNTVGNSYSNAIDIRYNSDDTDNSNIRITNSKFSKVSYGIRSNDSINNVKIIGNTFENNYRSIALRESTVNAVGLYGPQNVLIENNYFDLVSREGIYAGASTTSTNITSSNNIFRNVGNASRTDTFPNVTPVITFVSSGNVSKNDTFDRFGELQPSSDNIPDYLIKPLVDGALVWETHNPLTYDIDAYSIPSLSRPLAVIPFDVTNNVTLEVEYFLNRTDCIRNGKLWINANATSNNVIIRDEFSYQGISDGNTTFSANMTEINGGILLKYLTDGPGTVTIKVRSLQ